MIICISFSVSCYKQKKREKEWEKAADILISSFLPTTALFFAELGFSDRRIGLFMSMTL